MHNPNLDQEMEKLEQHLPKLAAKFLNWLRASKNRWLRIPMAILFVLGGLVGFLPILGFWMIPLGLALIAYDVPFFRPPMAKLTAYINRNLDRTR